MAVVLRQKIGLQNTHYVHGLRGIQSQHDGAGWSDAVSDGLGSVRGWLNSSQAFTDTNDYDPYGVPDASVVGYGFTGEMTDDNGLVYLRARYYDPSAGVFASLDPFEGVHDRPMSVNGYSWVEGNPINWIDPSGLCFWESLACIGAVALPADGRVLDAVTCTTALACMGITGVVAYQSTKTATELAPELMKEANEIVERAFRRPQRFLPLPHPYPFTLPRPTTNPERDRNRDNDDNNCDCPSLWGVGWSIAFLNQEDALCHLNCHNGSTHYGRFRTLESRSVTLDLLANPSGEVTGAFFYPSQVPYFLRVDADMKSFFGGFTGGVSGGGAILIRNAGGDRNR